MLDIDNQTVMIVLLVLVVWWVWSSGTEGFMGPHGLGHDLPINERYGLRGERWNIRPITDYYIKPNRHVRLNNTSGEMYVSNNSPVQEGIPGCNKVDCPVERDYDGDTCWMCNQN